MFERGKKRILEGYSLEKKLFFIVVLLSTTPGKILSFFLQYVYQEEHFGYGLKSRDFNL